jgi:hypothetical protein
MDPPPVQNLLLEELPGRTLESVRNACELAELESGDILSSPANRFATCIFQPRALSPWSPQQPATPF